MVIVFGSVSTCNWELMAAGATTVLDSDDDVEVAASQNKTGLVSIGHGLSHGSRPLNVSLAKPVEPVPDSQCPEESQLVQDDSALWAALADRVHDPPSPRRPALKRSNQFEGTPGGMETSHTGDLQSEGDGGRPTGYDSDSTIALGDEQRATQVTGRSDGRDAVEKGASDKGEDVPDDTSHHDVEDVPDDKSHHDVEDVSDEDKNEKGDEDEKPDADMMDLLKDPKFKKGTRMKDLSPNSQQMLKKVRKARNVQNSTTWHNKYASKGVLKSSDLKHLLKSSGAVGADGADGADGAAGSSSVGGPVHAEPVHAEPVPADPYQPLTLKDARATWLQYPF